MFRFLVGNAGSVIKSWKLGNCGNWKRGLEHSLNRFQSTCFTGYVNFFKEIIKNCDNCVLMLLLWVKLNGSVYNITGFSHNKERNKKVKSFIKTYHRIQREKNEHVCISYCVWNMYLFAGNRRQRRCIAQGCKTALPPSLHLRQRF